ncbi:hypothetical protein [Sphingobium boeckii]|uniref:Sulfotransferase family protein n=1 Tax=Sphingobium boeckii TaxID=1082345 RepID=A0A7W9AFF3_9SPHN|nr:hypothetical protein [Sphingobium boeckii]MBB5684659.1 hypothetical protein [Sphingobium boeckii]
MPLTLDDLFASPDHFLHSFEDNAALFMPMDRAAYHRSIFLDGRISPAADQSMRLPLATLTSMPRTSLPAAWIFHMAHCGSTLLARALDEPEASLVLREPLALRQTAIRPDAQRLTIVTAMISKRYRADAPTLIKANVPVNFLLPQLAAAAPAAHIILLYLPLREYLLAILRTDNHRNWLRNVTANLAHYLGDLSALTDAERAAALWRAQIDIFAEVLSLMPNARALDAERFFAEPERVSKMAALHLGIPIPDQAIERSVAGPLFSTYSKNPEIAFDNAARVARRAEVARGSAPEFKQAEAWLVRNMATASLPDALLTSALIR